MWQPDGIGVEELTEYDAWRVQRTTESGVPKSVLSGGVHEKRRIGRLVLRWVKMSESWGVRAWTETHASKLWSRPKL